jgi:hypothetical protein
MEIHRLKSVLLKLPRKAGPGVVRPAEAGQAAAEGAGYSRREKCLNVVEASGGGGALRGFVEREESLPALTGRAGGGIVKQIGFCGEAQQDGHCNARRIRARRGRFRRGIAMRHFPALSFSALGYPALSFPALGFPVFGAHIIDIVFED